MASITLKELMSLLVTSPGPTSRNLTRVSRAVASKQTTWRPRASSNWDCK